MGRWIDKKIAFLSSEKREMHSFQALLLSPTDVRKERRKEKRKIIECLVLSIINLFRKKRYLPTFPAVPRLPREKDSPNFTV